MATTKYDAAINYDAPLNYDGVFHTASGRLPKQKIRAPYAAPSLEFVIAQRVTHTARENEMILLMEAM